MRDFIFIEDVVSVFETIIDHVDNLDVGFLEFGVGTGTPIRVRDFVEQVHKLTVSTTRLEFGTVPYRDNELMRSQADTAGLRRLGWLPRTDLVTGLEKTIAVEKKLL